MRRPVLFLDDSGVLSDYSQRPEQWRRFLPRFYAARLGGARAAWAEADRVAFDWLSQPDVWNGLQDSAPDYHAFERAYHVATLVRECELVGVPTPSDDECVRLGREAEAYVSRRISSPLPGAVEAVRRLHALGYKLHTASGHNSIILDGYLRAMRVRDCFDRLYGPDLVNAFKGSPAYYERAFEDAGVSPEDALVVDDSAEATRRAVAVGARAVRVVGRGEDGVGHDQGIEQIESLSDLPKLLGEG